jgi:hypothetical protein
MGLHDDIKNQLKAIAYARSVLKKAEERLTDLVAQLLMVEDGSPPPPPPTPMDDARREAALKKLRKVGYTPRIRNVR